MGLFDRIGRVFRSNVNAAVSAAEDPEKILEQTVVDMQEDLVKLRQAVAGAIASQKRIEQQYNQASVQADEWYKRAQLALQKGEENLAREALSRKQTFAETAVSLKQQLDQSSGQVAKMRQSMTDLESKIAKYKTEKDMLKARAKAAKATEQLSQAMGQIDTTSAIGAFDRMKEKVLEMEAKSEAIAELAGDSLDQQFLSLEANSDVESELQLLKAQLDPSSKAIAGTPTGQEALPAGSTPVGIPQEAKVVDAELEELRSKLNQPPS
ncbi:MAG: PspA/IM30 family protein [Thermosynechococcaceae cyanobacterium MS004]|nr:PspA/IM30 family protein [Thermosynechococcaceae cyanobacterium MS004]